MLENHFTKTLQGELFRKFREEIMNIPDDLNMDKIGIYGSGTKKGVMWKLHNETGPEFPQECVWDFENSSGRNRAKGRVFGTVSSVRADTSSSVISHKREGSREVRIYADIAIGIIGMPLEE